MCAKARSPGTWPFVMSHRAWIGGPRKVQQSQFQLGNSQVFFVGGCKQRVKYADVCGFLESKNKSEKSAPVIPVRCT